MPGEEWSKEKLGKLRARGARRYECGLGTSGKSTEISNLDFFPEWEMEKSKAVLKEAVGLHGSLGSGCKKN